ncbi:MAG: hypothetical protein AAF191_12615 [Verrucomicrobiota bacterium]
MSEVLGSVPSSSPAVEGAYRLQGRWIVSPKALLSGDLPDGFPIRLHQAVDETLRPVVLGIRELRGLSRPCMAVAEPEFPQNVLSVRREQNQWASIWKKREDPQADEVLWVFFPDSSLGVSRRSLREVDLWAYDEPLNSPSWSLLQFAGDGVGTIHQLGGRRRLRHA